MQTLLNASAKDAYNRTVQPLDERIRRSMSAGLEELWTLVKDPHPEVLMNCVYNRNFSEDMAVFAAKRKNVPAELLTLLSGDRRFKDSYTLKMLICKNPRTPQRVVFSLLKFLRIFDLSDITKDQHIHINVRQKIEMMIIEKLKSLPAGIQKALARRANSTILAAIMEHGDETVVKVCLDNPLLTEGHVCSIINSTKTGPAVIRQIAENEKWTLRYYVRYALLRNRHAPLVSVSKYIPGIKTADLRDLYADPRLPSSTKPFIFRELLERGESVEAEAEVVHDLKGDEDTLLSEGGYDV